MPILECHALEKRYGSAMALDHIDLALEPGRIIGLLGPNGSGKSTLIKLAMGLLQPTSGEILIDGKAPSPQTNAVVSYLPDRVTLSPWMKTRQLLDFYCDFYADFDRQAAERMLTHLGLNLNQSIRQDRGAATGESGRALLLPWTEQHAGGQMAGFSGI